MVSNISDFDIYQQYHIGLWGTRYYISPLTFVEIADIYWWYWY